MRASSTSTTLPFPTSSNTTASTPPSSDDKSSFSEVLHQQGGSKTDNAHSKTANQNSDTQNSPDTTTTPATDIHSAQPTDKTDKTSGTDTTTAPKTKGGTASNPVIKPTTSPLQINTDLATMIVQAAAQTAPIATPKPMPTIPVETPKTDTAPTTPKESANPAPLDLTTLIAQAAIATSNAATSNSATAATPASTATPAATPVTTSAAATAAQVISTVATPVKAPTTPSGKEKKSASFATEGSFLQSGTASSNAISSQLASLAAASHAGTQNTLNQNLGESSNSRKSGLNSVASAASDTAGTANDNKNSDMTTSLNMAGLANGNRTQGINIPAADVHVHLTSNNDFNSALKHVIEVSGLSESSSLRAPLRVAMELQTPPGAVVNVYISKQADGYRAQLSTNDAAALSWVQNKLTELRDTNDLGLNVKWLPAQSESSANTVASTSGSNNNGLSWDRGGQNQQGQQQQDERQTQRQQKGDLFPGMPSLANNSFMSQLHTFGRAA